jgi:hypothetical protein
MLLLAKAFWDIAIWRRTPAQLPASLLLLAMVSILTALVEVASGYLPGASSERLILRIVLSVGFPLAFTWAVLAVARHRQRFLQTGIALLGIGVLAALILCPLNSLIHIIGSDSLASVALGVLDVIGFVWYMLACANIWRSALDSGIALGVAISVGYLVLTLVLEQQLLPDT